MYKCNGCKCRFDEPIRKNVSLESYYGVGNLFDNHNYTQMDLCPNCDDEDIEELKVCDICGEWFEKDELHYTEELENIDYGYCCEQCIEDIEMKEVE